MHKLLSIHPKQNQKQITNETNKLCMLQTGKKATKSVKKKKNNFNNVLGDNFATSMMRKINNFIW